MDTYNVMLSIQILSVLLFFGLPILARQIWLTMDQISFILFIVLFWLICSFVAIVSVYTWTAGFASWYYQWCCMTNFHLILGRAMNSFHEKNFFIGKPIIRNGKTQERLRHKKRSPLNGRLSRNRNTTRKGDLFEGIKSGNDHRIRWSQTGEI